MTFDEKNTTDPKGYSPVHLAVMEAIIDDKAFDIAKKLMYHPETMLNVKGPTGWSPLQETISYVEFFLILETYQTDPERVRIVS